VQKIITIPAGMQGVVNPCPRVEHPVWVKRLLLDKFSTVKQMSIKAMFSAAPPRKFTSPLKNLLPEGVSDSGDAMFTIELGIFSFSSNSDS
jgi:hypothetical protein